MNSFAGVLRVKLWTEHHLEFLSLKRGCTSSSESKLVKMPNCWKPHVAVQIVFENVVTILEFMCHIMIEFHHQKTIFF